MSEQTNPDDEPKIIVDDDWKSQVAQEKEQLKNSSTEEVGEPSSDVAEELHELPPATFMVLMSTLASQAMAAMGLLPDPISGKPTVHLPMAKHFIDLLAMLQEKTKGNLTEEESDHLRDGLHQLRMVYVSSDKQQPEQDSDTQKKSTIELP